jgi:hypothetical protein
MNLLIEASIKAIPTAIIAALTLLGGWFVTHRISARWDLWRKRRELDLAAITQFYATYGEFFSIWKLWASHPEKDGQVQASPEQRLGLLERAAAMEGELEGLLVKLATERDICETDRVLLARFREGLQCMRESIEKKVPLRTRGSTSTPKEWKAQGGENGGPGVAYGAFKELAGMVALIATSSPERARFKDMAEPGKAIREITTSAKYRDRWWLG